MKALLFAAALTFGGAAIAQDTQAPDNGSPERDRKSELAMAEAMMVHWGRQIVALAGSPHWPIEVAGRSRLARRPSASTQKEEHERA